MNQWWGPNNYIVINNVCVLWIWMNEIKYIKSIYHLIMGFMEYTTRNKVHAASVDQYYLSLISVFHSVYPGYPLVAPSCTIHWNTPLERWIYYIHFNIKSSTLLVLLVPLPCNVLVIYVSLPLFEKKITHIWKQNVNKIPFLWSVSKVWQI